MGQSVRKDRFDKLADIGFLRCARSGDVQHNDAMFFEKGIELGCRFIDARRGHEMKQGFSNLLGKFGRLLGSACQLGAFGEDHRATGITDVPARSDRIIVAASFPELKLGGNDSVLRLAAFRAPAAVRNAVGQRPFQGRPIHAGLTPRDDFQRRLHSDAFRMSALNTP